MKYRFRRPSISPQLRTLRTGFQISALLALASASTVRAVTYTYQGTGTTTTPISDNFSGNDFTPSLGTAGGTPQSTFADTLAFGGTASYTATDDFGSTISVGVVTFTNTAQVALLRGSSTATGANSFTLGSTTPTINLNNTAGTTGLVVNNLDLILGATTTITGAGSMTEGGTITSSVSTYGLTKGGTGTLTLNGATTYSGATTINQGALAAGANNVLSATSAYSLANATCSLNIGATTQTIGSIAATANGTAGIFGSNVSTSLLIVGGLNTNTTVGDGFGNITVDKVGTGTLTVNNSGTSINAAFIVDAGTLLLARSGSTTYAATAGVTVNAGTLQLGSNGNNILDTSGVTMTGGTFDLNGHTETIGGLSSTGGGNVTNTSATAATLTVGGTTSTATFAGTITNGTGTTALAKVGTGTQFLSGTNTYTGGTTDTAGVLEINTLNSLPNSGTGTTVAAGATLAFPIGGAGGITLANANSYLTTATFSAGSMLGLDTTAGDVTSSTSYSGTYGLNKLGTGTLTLTGANTYTGPTTLTTGNLVASGTVGTLSTATAISMNGNTLLSIRDDDTGTIAQGNTITLAASYGATATTAIDVRNNGGTTTGSVVAFGVLNNGTAATNFNNAITFTGANGYTMSFTGLGLSGAGGNNTYLNPTSTSVTFGTVTNQQNTASGYAPLNLNGTTTGNSITGTISDSAVHTSGTVGNSVGATSLSLNPTAGTLGTTSVWTLTGAISYSGTTTLANGGALILNTPSTSTSAYTVTVNTGGTLMGNGYAPTGLLTVTSGGNLAPGATASSTPTTAASVGILRVGALTLSTVTGGGSNFNILLGDNGSATGAGAGTSYSQLDTNGTVLVAGKLNLNLSGSLALNDKFFILLNSGTNTTSGTFSNIGASGSSFTTGGDTFKINYADNGDNGSVSNDVSLTVTAVAAVPEPSTYIGGLITLAFGAWTIRRRMTRASV